MRSCHGTFGHQRKSTLAEFGRQVKYVLMDATLDPKGLFSEAVHHIQKRTEDKKKEGEAFNLCLCVYKPRVHGQ